MGGDMRSEVGVTAAVESVLMVEEQLDGEHAAAAARGGDGIAESTPVSELVGVIAANCVPPRNGLAGGTGGHHGGAGIAHASQEKESVPPLAAPMTLREESFGWSLDWKQRTPLA